MTTTIHDGQLTSTDSMTSSSSHGAGFYFQCAIILIGVIGAAANALILYAMVASNQHKKQLLIFHQNVFDLCSCLLVVITYAVIACNISLTGKLGYWLCVMLLSENMLWCSINGSTINIMSITIERYIKVVHRSWSKKLLRKWMIHSAAAFAWISCITYNITVVLPTSAVIDGVCYGYVFWNSHMAAVIYAIWTFVSFFVVVVFMFIFCYWRILVVIRRQASVMAAHSGHGSSTTHSHTQSNQIQSNVTKTMIIVSIFFVITRLPDNVYYLLVNINSGLSLLETGHYVVLFLVFFYTCSNPFIYATKFEPVKRVLLNLISSVKKKRQTDGSAEMNGTGTATIRTLKDVIKCQE